MSAAISKMTIHKKLIEVALPLPEINDASAYDKMPGIGPHPKGIHHWWARLPLPTARAILFASVVDDPESHPEKWPTEDGQNAERERLFGILRRMMGKKLHEAPAVYAEARAEMLKHTEGRLPVVFDPFAGGGSIPLEANRMGFEAHAGDLNPVAVLLNKCNLEIAPRWVGHPPINPEERSRLGGGHSWQGTNGLAADLRYYGEIVKRRAIDKIGHLYPTVRLSRGQSGGEAQVIAWMWARTVASPNPAARGKHVPLISTYWLSTKKGQLAWLEPVVDRSAGTYRFEIRTGTPSDRTKVSSGTKVGRGGFKCILSDDSIPFEYVRNEGRNDAIGTQLIAIVADLGRGKVYLPANHEHELVAKSAIPENYPETDLPEAALGFRVQNYGIRQHWQLFSARQLQSMVTISDEIRSSLPEIASHALNQSMSADDASEYAKAVCTFLALSLDRCADFNCALSTWKPSGQQQMHLFTRQAVPMVWDYTEANLLGEKAICWHNAVDITAGAVVSLGTSDKSTSSARQIDAASGANGIENLLVSTDPPYYDNIGYAALSDFFYIWLRRTVGDLFPSECSTVLVPKIPELTASPERFDGNKELAKQHFEQGFRSAFSALREKMDHRYPLTVYYAFKQSDEDDGDEESEEGSVDLTTGWETLLEALISSGFQITATWPVRASQAWRMRAMGSNALASYIVLACRPRADDAPHISSNQFRSELKKTLPAALRHLQQGNIAPVDFAQASLGPGMAIYSRYGRILESSGTQLSIRAAINIINQTLTEVLSELEDDFDADTRWAIAWFEQYGFSEGDFGDAEVLSKAKVTSVSGLQQSGILISKGGKVRLLRPDELPDGWDPQTDRRLTVWEMTHHLLKLYHYRGAGDEATAVLLHRLGSQGDAARALAYRLFKASEKKKLAQEALGYNALVLGWPEIARLASEAPHGTQPAQSDLFERS
jgi:putative DNA methylase